MKLLLAGKNHLASASRTMYFAFETCLIIQRDPRSGVWAPFSWALVLLFLFRTRCYQCPMPYMPLKSLGSLVSVDETAPNHNRVCWLSLVPLAGRGASEPFLCLLPLKPSWGVSGPGQRYHLVSPPRTWHPVQGRRNYVIIRAHYLSSFPRQRQSLTDWEEKISTHWERNWSYAINWLLILIWVFWISIQDVYEFMHCHVSNILALWTCSERQNVAAVNTSVRTYMYYIYYRICTITTKPLAIEWLFNQQCVQECTFTTHLSSTAMKSYPSAVLNFRKSTVLNWVSYAALFYTVLYFSCACAALPFLMQWVLEF